MKKTSLEIYQEIRDNGVLKGQKLLVYHILARQDRDSTNFKCSRSLTAHEIRHYAETYFNRRNTESLPKRLSELERSGCIEVVGTRKCRVVGNICTEWAVTGRMPVVEKKPKFKVGDFAEVVGNKSDHYLKIGYPVKLEGMDDDGDWMVLSNQNSERHYQYLKEEDLKKL